MRHKSRGFSGGRLCRPVLCCLPRTSRARRLAAENKGTISGITMRSGEYEDLVHGGIVKRTPAAIEGIGSKEAIFGALENVLGSLGGLDSARSWEFLSADFTEPQCRAVESFRRRGGGGRRVHPKR